MRVDKPPDDDVNIVGIGSASPHDWNPRSYTEFAQQASIDLVVIQPWPLENQTPYVVPLADRDWPGYLVTASEVNDSLTLFVLAMGESAHHHLTTREVRAAATVSAMSTPIGHSIQFRVGVWNFSLYVPPILQGNEHELVQKLKVWRG